MKTVAPVALVLIVFSLCCTSSYSSSKDWTISITTNEVRKCVDYYGSSLEPLIKARVNFEQGYEARDDDEKALIKEGYIDASDIPSTVYEDIFYSRSMPVGLKRYKDLGIRPGTPGTIRVQLGEGKARQEEAIAAANATVRIFLDAFRKKSALKTIIVPLQDFDLFLDGMKRYNFKQFQISLDQPVKALFVVNVRSEPKGRIAYLGYGM